MQTQCRRCVLDKSAEEITFDEKGVCNFCHMAQRELDLIGHRWCERANEGEVVSFPPTLPNDLFFPVPSLYDRLIGMVFEKGHKIFLGRKHSEATKEKMREKATGRKHNEETKEKLRQGRIGMKHTEETKKKMSEQRGGENNAFYGKKHTMETQERLSAYRGELKGNWKGGITPIRKKERSTFEYQNWRKAVKERDEYKCLRCGSEDNLEADHIKSFAYHPELRFDIENGRTLCRDCHKKTDSYGKVEK